MIYIYTFFNLIFVFLSKLYYGKLFNPVSLYSIVWQIALTIHESGYLIYHELTAMTWLVIIFAQLLFVVGCLSQSKWRREDKFFDRQVFKCKIDKYIKICTVFSAISVFASLYAIVKTYGFNLLASLTDIYSDRVNENLDFQIIPYIGSMIYVSLPLAAVYLKYYGFSRWIVFQFVLVFFSSLTSGGRAGIVFSMVMFASAYVYANIKFSGSMEVVRRRKKTNKFSIYISIAALFAFFFVVTSIRVVDIDMPYISPMFVKHFGYNEVVYKIFAYFANPIGVLNEFMKVPEFYFGHNTLLPIYNILARIGLMDKVQQYQSWYMVPAPCNVGTWIRELYEDFSIFAFLVIFVFGRLTSNIYFKVTCKNSFGPLMVLSILMTFIALSFFDWRLRTSSMWIALFFGYYLGKKIEKQSYVGNLNS